MKIETVDISKLKTNPENPRTISEANFKKLVQSIEEFPAMLKLRPIVVDENFMVLGGNMRLKACEEAGLKHVPIIKASELTAEQRLEFIVKDNVSFGVWDFDSLDNNFDTAELEKWGLNIPSFSNGSEFNNMQESELNINEKFDPVGESSGLQRVVFIFDGKEEAESYLKSINVDYKKMNMAWQVNMSTQSI